MMISSQNGVEAGKRLGGGMKWSEVSKSVTQPDGSVRTSPRIKGGIATVSPTTVSPPRHAPPSRGPGKLGRLSCSGGSLPIAVNMPSSRTGSSRGCSSGTASPSSSLDGSHKARDGDISSRCSSGGYWDTCTNSSEHSRPRTPTNVIPSPSGANSLLMPDPIRTGLMWPPSLLDDETVQQSTCLSSDNVHKFEEPYADTDAPEMAKIIENQIDPGPEPGPISFKWDPHGRDVPRRTCEAKNEWSVEPLIKYLKRAITQIETNIATHRLPTAEKLDAFVMRLVGNTHRLLKHAPKDSRRTLHSMMCRRFQRFWNFTRNEKVRSTNPEELKIVMASLIEAFMLEFAVSPAVLTEPGRLHAPSAKHQHQRSLVLDPCGRV